MTDANRFQTLALFLAIALPTGACSTSDDAKSDGEPAAGMGGAVDAGSGGDGDGDGDGDGEGADAGAPTMIMPRDAGRPGSSGGDAGDANPEGYPCNFDTDCESTLRCVANGVFTVGVCARPCTAMSDCDSAEQCISATGMLRDRHCVNVVTEAFELCGVADTSVCEARDCLYFPDSAVGICVDICTLGDDSTCGAGQSCLTGLIDSSTQGVCGTLVTHGEPCGLESGLFCTADTDLCAPEDPDNLDSTQRCLEDCTASNMCSAGVCEPLQEVAYCVE